MEWYKLLGVDREANEKEIKIAYSKLLKTKGPDTDPEGYKELRSAFDNGIKFLKNKKSISNYIEYEEESEYSNNYRGFLQDSEETLNPIRNEITAYSFEETLENLYLILGDRVNIDNWKNLINSEFMWNSTGFIMGERLIINKISNNPYIPDEVIKLLSNYFNWIEREFELYDNYKKDTIDKLLNLIRKPSGIDYKPLTNFKDTRGDIYMEYRGKANENYETLAMDNAFLYAEKAYEIYQEDEVILGILAGYYYYNDKLDKALEYTSKALLINENYHKSCGMMGGILLKQKKYTEALTYYNKIKAYEEEHNQYFSTLYHGNCYYKLDNFTEAKRLLLKVKCTSKRLLKNDLRNTNRRLNGKKVFTKNKGVKANDIAIKKFIKRTNKSVGDSKKSNFKMYAIMIIAVLVYLPISVIIKLLGVIFRYNPVKIKVFDDLISLNTRKRIKLKLTNIKITNYYSVRYKNSSYEILKEQEVYDRGLWKEVESIVLMGTYDRKTVLFTGKNFTLNQFSVKDYKGTVIGRIDSLDKKIFEEIIKDYDISKQECFYGKIIINSRTMRMPF